jgi:hypothetical protein
VKIDPNAITKALNLAKRVGTRIDPGFAGVNFPKVGTGVPLLRKQGGRAGYEGGGAPEQLLGNQQVEHEPSPSFYAAPDRDNFYSKAATVAAGMPQASMSPEQWKGALANRGVKPAEMRWSNFDRQFAGHPKVSRADVANHFHMNVPPIAETVIPNGEYEEWSTPGGRNYREVLLHDPDYKEIRHQSNHFENVYGEAIPNIYAHLRLKDRETPEGKKLLHLEELQSDWGQEGRKGFRNPDLWKVPQSYTARDALGKYTDDLVKRAGITKSFVLPQDLYDAADKVGEMAKFLELREASQEEARANKRLMNMPVEGPYVGKTDDWMDLGLKHALTMAAREGYDELAWNPGQDHADRYDLSKHIRRVTYHRVPGEEGGSLSAFDPEGASVFGKRAMPDELAEMIGKDAAQRLLATAPREGKVYRNGGLKDALVHELEGENLKVGGEGLCQLYDKMLPKRLLRLAHMHDPDAEIESTEGVTFPAAYGRPAVTTPLHSMKITPEMRQSILENGFPAYNRGGAVRHFADGGDMGEGPNGSPLSNPVYHGTSSESVSSPIAQALNMEMFEAHHPNLNTKVVDPYGQELSSFWWQKHAMPLALGPHVSRDPSIAGNPTFTTGVTDSGQPRESRGKVMMLHTFPDEKFLPAPQQFNGTAYENDDDAVERMMYADALQNNPKLRKKLLFGQFDPGHAEHYEKAIEKGGPIPDVNEPNYSYPDINHFLKLNRLWPHKDVRKEVIKHFRKSLRDQGYAGVSYINTDKFETQNAKDKKCYIVIPQRDKETGWYPMRLRHAEFDPQHKASPVLTRADGGETDDTEVHTGRDVLGKNENLAGTAPVMGSVLAKTPGVPFEEMSAKYERKPSGEPWKEVDPEDLHREGAVIFPAVGDLSMAGRKLTHVGDTELSSPVNLMGGGEFMRHSEGAWASRTPTAKSTAKRIIAGNPEERPAYLSHTVMGLPSSDSSHMMAQTLIRMLPSAKLSKEAVEKFNTRMRRLDPKWPGIENHEAVEKHLLEPAIGTNISRFVKELDKGMWRKLGFPDVGQARFAVTEKRLLGAPQGSSGFALSKVKRTPELVKNPREVHETYAGVIPSEGYAGGFRHQIPAKVMFREWWERQRPETQLNPTLSQHSLMTQLPSQVADQQWLDEIMKHQESNKKKWGYKDGGPVDKALQLARKKMYR